MTFSFLRAIFAFQPKNKTTRIPLATKRIKQACCRHVPESAVCAARGTVSQPKIGFVLGSVTSPLPLLRPVRESRKKEHPAALCSIPAAPPHTPPAPPPPNSPHSSAQLSASLYLPSQSGGSGASPCSCLFCNLEQRAAF